ncbi:MAG: YaeQ family protein [Caldilineaceae bacterium]|nr:YaeQ family protein [Caldilineaceae bacterium]
MALSATIYNLTIELSDVDRGVYESLDLRVARQPSESAEFMTVRVLAYCLEYTEGISLSQGVAAGDEPAIWVRDLTGQPLAWIEVGLPDAERIHRGSRMAERAVVYTHRDVEQFLAQLAGKKIHRAEDVVIYALDRRFVEQLAARIDRRTALTVMRTAGELLVTVGDQTLSTSLAEHHIPTR